MDAHDQVKRMEKAIESEPNQFFRWKMRKVLKNTIKTMEESK